MIENGSKGAFCVNAKTVMNPARLRILEYFILHESATVAEMRRELSDIPQASLYRHMSALVSDGWLVVQSEEKKRGATERRYRLKPSVAENGKADYMQVIDVLMSLMATRLRPRAGYAFCRHGGIFVDRRGVRRAYDGDVGAFGQKHRQCARRGQKAAQINYNFIPE